jgi:hypothetical protein
MVIHPVMPACAYLFALRKNNRGYDNELFQAIMDVEYYLEEKLDQLGEITNQDFFFIKEAMKDLHSRLFRLELHSHYHICPVTGGPVHDKEKEDDKDEWAHKYPDKDRKPDWKYKWNEEGYYDESRNPESSHSGNPWNSHKVTPGPVFNSGTLKEFITETQEFIFKNPNIGDI